MGAAAPTPPLLSLKHRLAFCVLKKPNVTELSQSIVNFNHDQQKLRIWQKFYLNGMQYNRL